MGDRVEIKLAIHGSREDCDRLRHRAVGKMVLYGEVTPGWNVQQPFCFDSLISVPEYLRARTRWGYDEERRNGKSHGTYHDDPLQSGGAWEIENWGCKYGPLNCSEGEWENDALTYYFETRNAVPVKAFRRISAEWSTLRFHLEWEAEWDTFETRYLFVFTAGDYSQETLREDGRLRLPAWEDVRAEITARQQQPNRSLLDLMAEVPELQHPDGLQARDQRQHDTEKGEG